MAIPFCPTPATDEYLRRLACDNLTSQAEEQLVKQHQDAGSPEEREGNAPAGGAEHPLSPGTAVPRRLIASGHGTPAEVDEQLANVGALR
jgi:hypothetical protein